MITSDLSRAGPAPTSARGPQAPSAATSAAPERSFENVLAGPTSAAAVPTGGRGGVGAAPGLTPAAPEGVAAAVLRVEVEVDVPVPAAIAGETTIGAPVEPSGFPIDAVVSTDSDAMAAVAAVATVVAFPAADGGVAVEADPAVTGAGVTFGPAGILSPFAAFGSTGIATSVGASHVLPVVATRAILTGDGEPIDDAETEPPVSMNEVAGGATSLPAILADQSFVFPTTAAAELPPTTVADQTAAAATVVVAPTPVTVMGAAATPAGASDGASLPAPTKVAANAARDRMRPSIAEGPRAAAIAEGQTTATIPGSHTATPVVAVPTAVRPVGVAEAAPVGAILAADEAQPTAPVAVRAPTATKVAPPVGAATPGVPEPDLAAVDGVAEDAPVTEVARKRVRAVPDAAAQAGVIAVAVAIPDPRAAQAAAAGEMGVRRRGPDDGPPVDPGAPASTALVTAASHPAGAIDPRLTVASDPHASGARDLRAHAAGDPTALGGGLAFEPVGQQAGGAGWRLAAGEAVGAGVERGQPVAAVPRDVAGQITLAVSQASAPQVEIRLDPPELGRVQIRLNPTEGGGLQAVVLAERPDTQDFLRRHADTLMRDLNAAGYGEVTLEFASGGDAARRDDVPEERRYAPSYDAAPTIAAIAETPRRTAIGGLDIRL